MGISVLGNATSYMDYVTANYSLPSNLQPGDVVVIAGFDQVGFSRFVVNTSGWVPIYNNLGLYGPAIVAYYKVMGSPVDTLVNIDCYWVSD